MKRILTRLIPLVKGQPVANCPTPFHLDLDLARPSRDVLATLLAHPLVAPHTAVVVGCPELQQYVSFFNPLWKPLPASQARTSAEQWEALCARGGGDFLELEQDHDLPILAYETEQSREGWELAIVYPADNSLLETIQRSVRPANKGPNAIIWINFDGVVNLKDAGQEQLQRNFPDWQQVKVYGKYSQPLSVCFSPSVLARITHWFDMGFDIRWGDLPSGVGQHEAVLMRVAWALGLPFWPHADEKHIRKDKTAPVIWCIKEREQPRTQYHQPLHVRLQSDLKALSLIETGGNEFSKREVSGLTLQDCDEIDRLLLAIPK